MTQLKDGGRQPSNREERSLSASTVIARWQGNGWDEPCKSRGLRTVLWAAGGEIPPADPAAWNPNLRNQLDGSAKGNAAKTARADKRAADLLPLILPMKADGASLRQIADGLNRCGVPAPRSGDWSAVAVKQILEREVRQTAAS